MRERDRGRKRARERVSVINIYRESNREREKEREKERESKREKEMQQMNACSLFPCLVHCETPDRVCGNLISHHVSTLGCILP